MVSNCWQGQYWLGFTFPLSCIHMNMHIWVLVHSSVQSGPHFLIQNHFWETVSIWKCCFTGIGIPMLKIRAVLYLKWESPCLERRYLYWDKTLVSTQSKSNNGHVYVCVCVCVCAWACICVWKSETCMRKTIASFLKITDWYLSYLQLQTYSKKLHLIITISSPHGGTLLHCISFSMKMTDAE